MERITRLTSDELEIYFDGSLGGTADIEIFTARRNSISEAFGMPHAVTAVNSAAPDGSPDLSSDGLTLFFDSARRGPSEGVHIYVSTRTSRFGEFGSPSEVLSVASATITENDGQPFISADGQELWFYSARAGGGLGDGDMYHATWSGAEFGNIATAVGLNSTASDYLPTLSADKLTIYFSTRRSGSINYDIWISHRSTTRDDFSMPIPVSELNTGGDDLVGWLSLDNCRLYFSSDIAGTHDIYMATRHPK